MLDIDEYKFKLNSKFRLHLINDLGIKNNMIDQIIEKWCESHRYYHNIDHLFDILDSLETEWSEGNIDIAEYQVLSVSALFHDVIYDPRSNQNEEESIKYYKDTVTDIDQRVINVILSTKYRKEPDNRLPQIFWNIDNSILRSDINDLLEYEVRIRKEFQFVDYSVYKEERINFLKSCIGKFDNDDNLRFLINYIENYKLKVGFYPGSFNPLHIGHMNVIEKSEEIFDKIIIGVGVNPEKDTEHIEKEIDSLKRTLNRQVIDYQGLTTDVITQLGDEGDVDVTLIRGIRNSTDLNYENDQLKFMKEISGSDVKVIYIPCDEKYNHISSSKIRKLIQGGYRDEADNYLV